MLHAALLRTEPDFLLLNAEEGCAYDLLDPHPRPPLWERQQYLIWPATQADQTAAEEALAAYSNDYGELGIALVG